MGDSKQKKPKKRKGILLSDMEFNVNVEYEDAYYDRFIRDFQPNKKKRLLYRFIKRAFDMLASLLALILLSPLMIALAIAIKIESRGPVFFTQKRMGRRGKPFTCIKFRSMRQDAPHEVATSVLGDSASYQTKVGRFIRKYSLDELPQLFCCFIGTMSIIGPRPLILSEEKCNSMRKELGVYEMRPGISGYAQICGRDDVYYKNKAILDAEYVKNASVWLDLRLMFATVAVVFSRKGNKDDEKTEQPPAQAETVAPPPTETLTEPQAEPSQGEE